MIRAPYMPNTTPINSNGEIILPFQMAIRTTSDGLLIAEIAVTGPAGPPLVYAIFSETMPSEAVLPQMKPVMMTSHYAPCLVT